MKVNTRKIIDDESFGFKPFKEFSSPNYFWYNDDYILFKSNFGGEYQVVSIKNITDIELQENIGSVKIYGTDKYLSKDEIWGYLLCIDVNEPTEKGLCVALGNSYCEIEDYLNKEKNKFYNHKFTEGEIESDFIKRESYYFDNGFDYMVDIYNFIKDKIALIK